MIRFIIGLLIVLGAVGGMEDPTNPLLANIALAMLGLATMAWGTTAINFNKE